MAAAKEKDQRFDQAKLQAMHEPLTVRVEKMRGNVRQPISLPAKGSQEEGFQPPGTNWTRDEVLDLENFILTKWAGGGYYEFTVTDAKGDRMTWSGVWDPRVYPEQIPPNTAEAAFRGPSTPTPVSGPQPVPPTAQPLGSAHQSGWPASFATGYNNPPHTGPIAPPTPPTPQAPPMWAGGMGPQQPHAPWGGPQAPWGAPQGPWGPSVGPWGPATGPTWGVPQGPWGPSMGAPGYGMPQYGGPYGTRRDRDRDRDRDRRFDRFDDDEKRELENKLRASEIEKKDLEHRQALERQQAQHEQQMKALQDEIRRIGETRGRTEDEEVRRAREEAQRAREEQLKQQHEAERRMMEQQMKMLQDQLAKLTDAPRGESDELRRLREEQERIRQDHERQRQEQERKLEQERAERERERERYDRERRDEALQREMKESREANERRFEQLAAAQNANATNPVIEALKESARLSAENMKEMARAQQSQTDRLAAFMVAPAQLAQIMKDNNSGSDVMMRNIVDTVGGIGTLYKSAAETIMQMNQSPAESPAVRLVQEGIGQASAMAERYLQVKRDQVISDARVKQAQAQTEATRVAAEAQVRAAAMNAQAANMRGSWAPPPPVANAGLGGTSPAQPADAGMAPKNGQQPAAPTNDAAPANGTPTNVEASAPNGNGAPSTSNGNGASKGPSEEEMFGIALESVHRLRRGVAEGNLNPSETIDAILQGVEHVITNQLVIPAFTLFTSNRWADFMDVMLPQAPQAFRDECVRILIEEVEAVDSNNDSTADNAVESPPLPPAA